MNVSLMKSFTLYNSYLKIFLPKIKLVEMTVKTLVSELRELTEGLPRRPLNSISLNILTVINLISHYCFEGINIILV